MAWVETDAGGYRVALDEEGRVVCRNAAGRALKSVPSKLGDDPVVTQLKQLAEWLAAHERRCQEDVERWMVRSLPVPAAVLAAVWPDEAWRAVLRDVVVTGPDGAVAGFLRDADAERGLGLVDLDGDTVRLTDGEVLIPHPVLLPDLDDLREFAVELGVSQRVQQLYREVWHRPDEPSAGTEVTTYAGGRYRELRELVGRCTRLGCRVRGGSAVQPITEGGRTVEARVWVGDYYEYDACETGALSWAGPDGRALPLAEVGPVAWSEGMRTAAALYAGRTIEGEEAA
ncbi:DUF4132 domain-containing protein [Kitasatospora aureofaciens]|uniref:DUF4132 domain-containing protein n=1 Tax=Kitasatospora aureofaciens TaxID=1894 RepID=A0A1E7N001_KITAU|nr:hypothetical protein B6264_02020 [Kitasatospora aureofaciens]OEV34005.1 hypothetical protein HS99_0011175 [Kitasatospora aureofaciens]GGU73305.1 hypothetical protein GCM10010502_26160 [Kitasatospora aureofaciens]